MRRTRELCIPCKVAGVGFDQVMQKYVIDMAVLVGNAKQAGKFARHGHHAEKGCARLGISAQLKRHAQSLIKDVRKRMRRINRDRSQNRIHAGG